MKRLLAILALSVALIGTAMPASATYTPHGDDAFIGAGRCSAYLTFSVDHDIGGSTFADVRVSNYSGTGTCAYIGMKVQYRRCDGTTYTTAEIGVFNPQGGLALYDAESWSCAVTADMLRMQVRTDDPNGVWNPSPAGYISFYHGGGSGINTGYCSPAYCIT